MLTYKFMNMELALDVTPTPYGTFDPTKPMYASLSPELTGCKCVYHHSHIYYDPLWTFFHMLAQSSNSPTRPNKLGANVQINEY